MGKNNAYRIQGGRGVGGSLSGCHKQEFELNAKFSVK
jgi:hypothetical protein